MQPSNALIAIGLSAVVALSPIKAAAAQTDSEVTTTGASEGQAATEDAIKLTLADKPLPEASPLRLEASRLDRSAPASIATDATDATEDAKVTLADHKPLPAIATVAAMSAPDLIAQASTDSQTPTAQAPAEAAPAADVTTPNTAPDTASPADTLEQTAPEAGTAAESASPDAATTPAPPAPDGTPSILPPSVAPGVAAPEYLFNNPNPLEFPTRPEEVQITGTQPITLEQAIELAQRNSRDLQVAQLTVERARAALRQAEAANLPTLDLGASTNSTQVTTPGARNPLTGAEVSPSTTTLETTLGANLQLSYPLFTSGQRSATIRANERQVRFQELQLEVTAEDLRQNVTRDYYSVQEADELVRIAQSSVEQNQQSVRDAQAQEAAGIGTRFDVLQAQVDLSNSQQDLTQRLSDQRVARRQLAQRINLPQAIDISAADPIAIASLWDLSLEDSTVLAFRNRAELEQQLVQREISQQQRRIQLAQSEPQVSLVAGYNVNNNISQGTGFIDNYQFGAQFNLNLFDGGASQAAADQEEANIATAEAQFANARDLVRFQVEQAFFNLQASFENIQTTTLALQQATESLRLARLRFQAGVGIQSDVLRAQTALTEAEVNRLQAVLGYNRSLTDLRRAVSNFPDTNLADTP